MLNKLWVLVLLAVASSATLVLFAATASAQVYKATPWEYNWPIASTTGVVGQYLILDSPQGDRSTPAFTVEVYITGTQPSVCTFEIQDSPDGVAWSTGTASISGDQSCASSTPLPYHYFSKPVRNIRINIGTLTGADASTRIHFFYTDRGNGN